MEELTNILERLANALERDCLPGPAPARAAGDFAAPPAPERPAAAPAPPEGAPPPPAPRAPVLLPDLPPLPPPRPPAAPEVTPAVPAPRKAEDPAPAPPAPAPRAFVPPPTPELPAPRERPPAAPDAPPAPRERAPAAPPSPDPPTPRPSAEADPGPPVPQPSAAGTGASPMAAPFVPTSTTQSGDERVVQLLERIVRIMESGQAMGGAQAATGASLLAPSRVSLGTPDVPDPEAGEGYPAASPSVNVTTFGGAGGASSFRGFGSRTQPPQPILSGGAGRPAPSRSGAGFFEPGRGF